MVRFFKSTQDACNRLVPIDASIRGDAISFTSNVCSPVHDGKAVLYCKGASLLSTGTDGLLAVHLVNDPAGVWYLLDLVAGSSPLGAEFDLVSDSHGTTVVIDAKLYIYPAAYKNDLN